MNEVMLSFEMIDYIGGDVEKVESRARSFARLDKTELGIRKLDGMH